MKYLPRTRRWRLLLGGLLVAFMGFLPPINAASVFDWCVAVWLGLTASYEFGRESARREERR